MLKVTWCAVHVCVSEGYQSNRTDTTSSVQTEHQVQSSHSSFNTDTICVRVRELNLPQRVPDGPVCVKDVFACTERDEIT